MLALYRRSAAVRGAVLSLAYLLGGLALGFPTVGVVSSVAPRLADALEPWLFFVVMAVVCGAAGAAWARHLAGGRGRTLALLAGGAIGYGLSAPATLWGLTFAETTLLERAQAGQAFPMHVVFGAIFTAGAFCVVLASSLLLTLGAGLGARAWRVALRCALLGAGSFLAVDAAMDLAGFRVGAPGAEKRFTMLVVLALGLLVATTLAGAALGRALHARGAAASDQPAARLVSVA